MKKTVLVTGSSRGIGKAIARKFAENDCNVIINCSSCSKTLEEELQELRQINPNTEGFVCDVSDYEQTKELFAKIEKRFGQTDILVNNAGVSHIGLFNDMSPQQWDALIKNNLYSVFNTCHLVVPSMINNKSGVIINISSIWGSEGASMEAVYSATKGGINAFTKALAKELAPSNIKVNAIACGVIETQMNNFLSPEEKEILTESIPMGRFGTVEEIAELVYFLSTEKCAYLTGQIIGVNGGF